MKHITPQSITKTAGILAVFALPLLFLVTSITRDIIKPIRDDQVAAARSLYSDEELQGQNLKFETSVFDEPVISVVFDDGWQSAYTAAFPILEKYGIDTTQFIITNTFGDGRYMSVEQMLHMQAYGHEIGSHTVTHANLTQLNDEELDAELKNSRLALDQLTGQTTGDIAPPLGAYGAQVQHAAKQYYRSLRTTQVGINTRENFDVFALRSPTVLGADTAEDIQSYIDEAIAANGWLILTYHQIDNSDSIYAVMPELFEQHMRIIAGSDVDIQRYGDVLDSIGADDE